jgi:proline dehydrogenase
MAVIERFLAPDSPFSHRFFFLAKRFIAGETIAAGLAAVRSLNAAGLSATLDFLGEDVIDLREAQKTRDTYLELLAAIGREGVRTNVSVKLTALGLLVDESLCAEHLGAIVERAESLPDPFVRIDMEGDVERAIELGARVRLCKGAYSEPPAIALQDMPSIRAAYLRLAQALLVRGTYPAIATHDERLIEALKRYASAHEIGPERFEFQLLYGVRTDLQQALVRDGYRVRVYVPFGTHWAGYFYRRITERKENAWFALRSMFGR